MPSFLLKKENRAAFLALIFLFLLVVVPVIVLNELKSIGKFDDNGVLLSNMPVYERFLEENLIVRKCPGIVSQVGELANAQVKSRNEENDLNRLAKELIEEADLRKISNFEVAEAMEMTKKAK
jgi:translocation protein SEC63